MTFAFLQYVTCFKQSKESSFVQSFEDVKRTMDNTYDRAKSGLTHIPRDIPPKAKYVYLYLNNIKKIPNRAFSHLQQCKILSLQNNKLSQLKRGMLEGLQALQQLVLSSNYIRTIEARAFLHLTSCTWLSLKENRLTYIRSDIFEGLESLNTLILSQNIIFKIEPGILRRFNSIKGFTPE